MIKILNISKRLLRGIMKNDKSLNYNVKLFGCDTETFNGDIFSLQIVDETGEYYYEVNKNNAVNVFLKHINDRLNRNEIAYVMFHNLEFDLVALFSGIKIDKFKYTDFKLKIDGWDLHIFSGKSYFTKAVKGKHKTIWVVDSYKFLPFSLKNIAKVLNLELRKLKIPEGLGTKIFKESDKDFKEFKKYAMMDAKIEYEIVKYIFNIHKEYDVRLSVSLPNLASHIFRHKFLKEGETIQYKLSDNILSGAISSYHGGKNGFYIKPGFYKNLTEIDLNSAYPYAMKCLPSFLDGEYKRVDKYINPNEYVGIYCITGKSWCPYNITFNNEFKPVKEFENIWITSYELEQAFRYNEIEIDKIFGYIWIPKSDRNPFADYIYYFYDMKQKTDKINPKYIFYKLMMNSLYGKLIQTTEIHNESREKEDYELKLLKNGQLKLKRTKKNYNAGGMFQPFIASLITGKTRAMIHELEHKFQAVHTATDSVKTFLKVDKENKELGGYKKEVEGDCIIFRNKFYLHFDKENKLRKWATHGFQGNFLDAIKLYLFKDKKYKINHLFKVREALIQNKKPLIFEEVERNLSVNWFDFEYHNLDVDKYYIPIKKNNNDEYEYISIREALKLKK